MSPTMIGSGAGRSLLAAALLAILVQLPDRAVAAGPGDGLAPIRAASLGQIVEAPDGRSEMELVRFEKTALHALLRLGRDKTVRLEDWPVAPGLRCAVLLRRVDVYAPDAKIIVVSNGVSHEAPRTRLEFFRGLVIDGPEAEAGFVFWVDPETLEAGGFATTSKGTMALAGESTAPGSPLRLAPASAFQPAGVNLGWTCGVDDAAPGFQPKAAPAGHALPNPLAPNALTKSAVIAFDTDAEYLNLRFANNTTSATNYVAQLVAGMSVIYERDAGSGQGNGVKILQGYTILRVGEASDPYSDVIGTANITKLSEFLTYWETNYPRSVVKRALAVLLSGKDTYTGPSSWSASGIAWIGALCGGSGYSIDQLFTTGIFGVTYDLGILAHEVGHNFGAPHTHSCSFTPVIDACVTPEWSCGSATGCPGAQTFNGVSTNGTLMSYCHMISCAPRNLVFHTRSITDASYGILVEINGASCLNTLAGGVVPSAPTITNVSPATGSLAGGAGVTITGTNFGAGTTVAFVELPSNNVFGAPVNSKSAAVTTWSATSLTVTSPSATNTGAVDVVAMNSDFQTATRASGFTYQVPALPPTVTSISPDSGSTAGSTPVTVRGTGFASGAGATIGGTALTGVSVPNTTTLTGTTGAHAAGTFAVVVTNPDTQSGTLSSAFFYAPPPAGTQFYALTPCRVVETRNLPGGPQSGPVLAAGEERAFPITATGAGTCGVPDTAVAVSANVTTVQPGAAGELKVFPGDGVVPVSTSLSFNAAQTRANNAMLYLSISTDGSGHRTIKVKNVSTGSVHVIVDVNGYAQ